MRTIDQWEKQIWFVFQSVEKVWLKIARWSRFLIVGFLVRGYSTTKILETANGGSDQDTIKELLSQKQALLLELKQYQNNTKYNEENVMEDYHLDDVGVIPANTRLQIGISTNDDSNGKVLYKISSLIFLGKKNCFALPSLTWSNNKMFTPK